MLNERLYSTQRGSSLCACVFGDLEIWESQEWARKDGQAIRVC